MDTSIPPEKVVVVDEQHNPYKNFANFINSARHPSGVMPEVIGDKAYPPNHPLTIELQAKAEAKRNRKRTDKQMVKKANEMDREWYASHPKDS